MVESAALRPFFYGRSEHRLNSKGQVVIPKRFRDILPEGEAAEGFVLLRGEGSCLYMYTHRQFGEIRQRARQAALDANDPEFFRSFMESAHAVDLDAQGRFVLPVVLREEIGLRGADVLFVGMDDRIEIWEPSARADERASTEAYEQQRQQHARRIFGL